MQTLDMILFIADYIEPCRDKAANLEQIREMAFRSLEQTVEQILFDTLHYLNQNRAGSIQRPRLRMNITKTGGNAAYEYYK